MSNGQDDQEASRPAFDELKSKRFGRHVRDWIRFRDEVLAGDPESPVSVETAAAILDLKSGDIEQAMDDGRLGFIEVEGERVIRVTDLRAAYDEETRRLEEAARGFTQLNAPFGWEE